MGKVTKKDWKTIMVGLFLVVIFIAIRFALTNRLQEWLLAIFDLMIGIFGGGVLLFILSEVFGRNIINRLKG